MWRRSLWFAIMFFSGAVCGVISVRVLNRSHDEQALFSRKLRCQAIARDFIQKRSDQVFSAFLDRVDYSAARRSCIAEETDTISEPGSTLWAFNLMDVVTGEQLFSAACTTMTGDCSSKASAARDQEFQNALRSSNAK